MKRSFLGAALAVRTLSGPSAVLADHIIPAIEKGNVAVSLIPVATGMAAPDYAISPPGDARRLFVVEQNGLLRIIQDGALRPGAALDLGPRMAGSFNATNANDERGFLGLAFHPGYATPASPGFRTLYTYNTEPIPTGTQPTFIAPNNATQNYKLVVNERGRNYGWGLKEGTYTFNRANGTIGVHAPNTPSDLTDPIRGSTGAFLQYDHGDGISITGGFVYRGSDIPELFGKYVFGDLAIRNAPPRVDGRLFYADLELGTINEFLLPQFESGQLPDGLTVHGFGQDGEGELYALVTNTPANGNGGIVYKFGAVPEPGTAMTLFAIAGLLAVRRRR